MSDIARDAFKVGFLTRCAEEGLTGAAIDARLALLEKRANGGLSDFINAGTTLTVGLPIGLGVLGGGALGYGAAKMTEPVVSDDAIKAQELAHAYRVYANRIKARRAMKQYRPAV
ncbi:hypothetical protein EBU71_13245 [bacterium]|nr:hypothetical protein [Candidatus Elulimicrobium humile]